MARRASSGVSTQALLIGALVFVFLLGGGYWFLNRKPAQFDAPALDLSRDVDGLKSLAGNKNSVTGILVDRQIKENGQFAVLQVGDETNPNFLPIRIPDDFKGGNLNLRDKYVFLVEFDIFGIAVAIDAKQF